MSDTPNQLRDEEYALIADESMMIASQKLVPTLAAPASHPGRPIRLSDVRMLGVHVASSWNAEKMSRAFDGDVKKVGHAPLYAITDNDHKMKNAVRLSGITRIHDISHTLAMFMERVYKKDADFVEFNSMMADCKKRHCMKELACLQPPSQRVIARFMNLSDWIGWASSIMTIYHTLPSAEREAFSFVPKHASFIGEMREVVSCIRLIEQTMKNEGLSKDTIAKCGKMVRKRLTAGNARMRDVGRMILDYLHNENLMLREYEVWNNSTDIIESIFGIQKYTQSPNKLNGVTTLILHLPVLFRMSEEKAARKYNIKERMCNVKIRDIIKWRNENLLENHAAKRVRILHQAKLIGRIS